MKESVFQVSSNRLIAKNVWEMILKGDVSAISAPGQFVNLKVEGCFLRRPISVCNAENGTLTLVYKVVGTGTERMTMYKSDDAISILTGLGNGYDLSKCGDRPLLIGGGVGVPPMYMLCRELIAAGRQVSVILGFNTADEVFYEQEFAALGAKVYVMTADGSYGGKGFVTDAMKDIDYTYFYTCGPMPMFKAINKTAVTGGQFSFEERMGCGFGACMGCSCKTLTGNKRICKDGPVLEREEIIWEQA